MTDQIPVTYKCWGCGSQKVELEETDIPMPAREQWNVCPDCRKQGVINEIINNYNDV